MRHVSHKELSAYIDGEARRPGDVVRHLQHCAECARRHRELAGLSAGMHGLPAPDVHPAFTTRVMASVREAKPAPFRRRVWRAPALGALLVAVAVAALLLARGPEPAPPTVATVEPAEPAADPERLMALIADRVARGEDPDLLALSPWDATQAETDVEDQLAALTETDWFGALAFELEAEQDVDTLLSSLSPEEAEAFRQMLTQYAQGG